jgi:hypothetical protein
MGHDFITTPLNGNGNPGSRCMMEILSLRNFRQFLPLASRWSWSSGTFKMEWLLQEATIKVLSAAASSRVFVSKPSSGIKTNGT